MLRRKLAMRYLLDILQAAGIGSATGIRPFLPALAAGLLARADVGVDFEGTAFAFLESPIFLAALIVAMAVSIALARYRPDDGRLISALSGIGIGLGALSARGRSTTASRSGGPASSWAA